MSNYKNSELRHELLEMGISLSTANLLTGNIFRHVGRELPPVSELKPLPSHDSRVNEMREIQRMFTWQPDVSLRIHETRRFHDEYNSLLSNFDDDDTLPYEALRVLAQRNAGIR